MADEPRDTQRNTQGPGSSRDDKVKSFQLNIEDDEFLKIPDPAIPQEADETDEHADEPAREPSVQQAQQPAKPEPEEKTGDPIAIAREALQHTPAQPDNEPAEPQEDRTPETQPISSEQPAAAMRQTRRPIRRRKNRGRVKTIKTTIYILVVLGISIFMACFILFGLNDVFGIIKQEKVIDVEITKNSTAAMIADTLKDNGIIDHPLIFRMYSKLKKADSEYKYGIYKLSPKMAYDEIISNLKEPGKNKDAVKVTIPEGTALRDIANILQTNKVCKAENFMKAVNEHTFDFPFLKEIEQDGDRFYNLEGYLFPDTYEFSIDQAEDTVVEIFLQNFQSKLDAIPDLHARLNKLGMSVDEMVTLASIIQQEASKIDQMKMVSSVFHNRLNNPSAYPKLQSDPTHKYVEKYICPVVNKDINSINSPYDTYVGDGLPPGPICNPGLEAMDAALNPSQSTYYFFVTDVDGNYYYNNTLIDHDQTITNLKKAGKWAD